MSTLTLDRRNLLKVTATAGALAATASALNLEAASANTSTARTTSAATTLIDSYHNSKKLNLGSKVGGVQTITYSPYPNVTIITGYLQNYTGGYIFAEHPDYTHQFSNSRRKPAGIGFVRKGSGIDTLIKDHNAKNPGEKLYPVSAEYTVESRVISQELRVARGSYPDTNRAFYAYVNWFTNTGNGLLITNPLSVQTILTERNAADPINAKRNMDTSSLMPDMSFFQTRSPWVQKDEFTTAGASYIHNTLTSGIDNAQFHQLQVTRGGTQQAAGYLRIGGLFSQTVCGTLKNTRTYQAVDFDADLSRNLRYNGSKASYFGYYGVPVGAWRGRDGQWNSRTFIGLIWVEGANRMFTISDPALFKELRYHGARPIQAEIKNADGSISIYTASGTYTSKNGVVTFTSV